MFTEFVSADGLCHPEGKKKLMHHLLFSEKERPIVAQLFGANPENMEKAAEICKKLGFDGIDVNMGCPVKNICKQEAGAELLKDPDLAKQIIAAVKKGAGGLPVSVKTRIGYSADESDTWIPTLLKMDLAAITIHLRTKKEMSAVPAHWDIMPKIVGLRNDTQSGKKTLIIGNGDVKDLVEAKVKAEQYGCDGIMLGRAVFGNPWLFNSKREDITTAQKLKVMIEHTKLFEKLFSGVKNFAMMKKHYKAYCSGFLGAAELRFELMKSENSAEAEAIVHRFQMKNTK